MNKISVIVPAYNEEKNIYDNLTHLSRVLDDINLESEIVVVSDGSTDNTYSEAKRLPRDIILIHYPQNEGKGFAIRKGFYKTSGDLVAFIDADMDIHPQQIDNFLKHIIEKEADIIIGSKRHPDSVVNYPFSRQIMSRTYQLFIRILFGLNVSDTQVGLKIFKRKVLEDVLPRVVVKKYAFDLELLVVAYMLGYKKIHEVPIEINYKFRSSVSPKAVKDIIQDTCAIFYRKNILNYYKKNKEIEFEDIDSKLERSKKP